MSSSKPSGSFHIALLRCAEKPAFITWDIGDLDQYFEDDRLLIAAFAERGHHAAQVIWSDRSTDWTSYDIVIVRSTWDYIDHIEEFLLVTDLIEQSGCTLINSSDIIRWNADKAYLLDLQRLGIPVVPTFQASDDEVQLQKLLLKNGWQEAIIKPRIGGGASEISRIAIHDLITTLAEWSMPKREKFLVQPMLPSIMTEGEHSFIYLGGKLSYVHQKRPAGGDYRVQSIYGGTLEVVDPKEEDAANVNSIVNRLPFRPLYARIDLVRLGEDLVIMELEMIEPILNFKMSPQGVNDFVESVLQNIVDS